MPFSHWFFSGLPLLSFMVQLLAAFSGVPLLSFMFQQLAAFVFYGSAACCFCFLWFSGLPLLFCWFSGLPFLYFMAIPSKTFSSQHRPLSRGYFDPSKTKGARFTTYSDCKQSLHSAKESEHSARESIHFVASSPTPQQIDGKGANKCIDSLAKCSPSFAECKLCLQSV